MVDRSAARSGTTEDDALLRRYAEFGSEPAFAQLMERYYDFVFSVCRRMLGDAQLAEDVTQTVFLLLSTKAKRLAPGTVISGWLFKVAHLACRNARRAEARRTVYEHKAAGEMEKTRSPQPPSAPSETLWDSVEPRLDDALARLSPPDREAILLRYVDGLNQGEMAAALGITSAAAQKRALRALQKLKRNLGFGSAALSVATLSGYLGQHMIQPAPPGVVSKTLLAFASVEPLGAVGGVGVHVQYQELVRGMKLIKLKAASVTVACCAMLAGGAYLGIAAHTDAASRAAAPNRSRALPSAPGGAVSGVVAYSDGAPAAGVSVEAQSFGGVAYGRTVTDAQGHYAITGLAPNRYNVAVDETQPPISDQWTTTALPNIAFGPRTSLTGQNFTLVAGAMVTGSVTWLGTDTPASGVQVGIYGPAHPQTSPWVEAVTTDAKGRFSLRVPPGRQRIYVMRMQDIQRGKNIQVSPGGLSGVRLDAIKA